MNDLEFAIILKEAISGNKKSIQEIINMYMPIIRKYSIDYQTGVVDEDCISTIIEKLQKEISKFEII